VHGFDPRGPALLHAIQSEDAGRESARPDRTVVVGPRRRQPGASAWTVTTDWRDDETVQADYVALRWDDLVRSRWDRSLTGQARGLAGWLAAYIRAGAFIPLATGSLTLSIAMLALPVAVVVFCLFCLIVAGVAAWGLAQLAAMSGLPPFFGLAAFALLLLAPAAWRRFDGWANLCWLGRGHQHMVELSRGDIAGMDDRIGRFADRLLDEAASGDRDDILVVGHSSGALHAVSMIGRAVRRRPDLGRAGSPLRLITLGHSIPPYAMLGPSGADADALAALVEADWISWVDVTAAADPGAAGVWNPLRHSPFDARQDRVVRRLPRFHRALSPEAFRALKRDPMAYHFQYMRASDHPDVYDWHRMAFGPGSVA
jgi:hypothetical protein